jgi:hypothetical protein
VDQYISGEEHQRQQQSQSPPPNKKQVTISTGPIISVVIAVLVIALSFFLGTRYEKSHVKSTSTTATAGGFTRGLSSVGGRFGGNRGDGVFGTVTAISSSSITIDETRSNSSTKLSITSSTTLTDDGSSVGVSAIQTGDTVFVTKTTSTSTTASSIMVNPSFGSGHQSQSTGSSTNSGSADSGSSTGSVTTD